MSFNFTAFEAKLTTLSQALPALSALIQATEVVAPACPGLTKAAAVINTAIAVEPALATLGSELTTVVTGLVSMLRGSGQLQITPPPQTGAA